ncbi:MAG TPA: hypothetical protein VIO81_15105, partial [Methyloversatilis sp.]
MPRSEPASATPLAAPRLRSGRAALVLAWAYEFAFDACGVLAGRESHTARMRQLNNSNEGTRMIAARFATVEPVFGNLRHNERLTRFTLRRR